MNLEAIFEKTKYEIKPVSELKLNPDNPRYITAEDLELLKEELVKNPKGLLLNPLKINSDGVVLGGNQRLTALLELGWQTVPVIIASDDLTEEEINRFIVVDNVGFGKWDYDKLKDLKWSQLPLKDWKIIAWDDVDGGQLEDFFTDPMDTQEEKPNYTLTLKFTEKDYNEVIKELEHRVGTNEQIIYSLLCKEQ